MRIHALALVLSSFLAACATTPASSPVSKPDASHEELSRFGTLHVKNPTSESWELALNGTPRGIIAPNGQLDFPSLHPGRATLTIRNGDLGLQHVLPFALTRGEITTVELPAALAQVRIHNPNEEAIEVLVHGVRLGVIEAQSAADFSAVPAGQRSVLVRSVSGPSSTQFERFFPIHQTSELRIPPLQGLTLNPGPKAPKGQSLIRVHNGSGNAITLTVSSQRQGVIQAGAYLDVVLTPGRHEIEVLMETINARTYHFVTLKENQAAEWVWQEP